MIAFPLDDGGFFRRECPFCCREFKILPLEDELNQLVQDAFDSFMLQAQGGSEDDGDEDDRPELFCPYCGQEAPNDQWWTQEQIAYVHVHVHNLFAKTWNEGLARPLRRSSRHSRGEFLSVRIEADEMQQREPWISPEENDMTVFDLPCCNRKLKVDDGWSGTTNCFFCGFPHRGDSLADGNCQRQV